MGGHDRDAEQQGRDQDAEGDAGDHDGYGGKDHEAQASAPVASLSIEKVYALGRGDRHG
jgi:hypothetical protein